jgi:hypothetical protein
MRSGAGSNFTTGESIELVRANISESVPMHIGIIEHSIRFQLHGINGTVENEQWGAVGMQLMNQMWQTVKSSGTPTTGINHWVYLGGGRMFVGVELKSPPPSANGLEPLAFELSRYLKHVHVGPYQALPQKWKDLQSELAARGEVVSFPSLEIYGHHCEEPSQLETTILIGLQKKA